MNTDTFDPPVPPLDEAQVEAAAAIVAAQQDAARKIAAAVAGKPAPRKRGLSPVETFRCPINWTGCVKNCGAYGCGN